MQTRLQGLLIVIGLAALAIPLAGAEQIAVESVARRQIRDAVLMPFGDAARISQLDIDFDRRPVMVRAAVLTPAVVPDADRRWRTPGARRRCRSTCMATRSTSGSKPERGKPRRSPRRDPAIAGQTAERVAGAVARIAGVAPDALVVDSEARRIGDGSRRCPAQRAPPIARSRRARRPRGGRSC
ncbi:hypothetical protein ABC347_04670 [Sphingomonas sp. 1P06PA]|uniref:hypothetical protein n=1 Tax=Sphingomonas sp. 1P06PA TaxID=554121 RepID=UPI0039A65436